MSIRFSKKMRGRRRYGQMRMGVAGRASGSGVGFSAQSPESGVRSTSFMLPVR